MIGTRDKKCKGPRGPSLGVGPGLGGGPRPIGNKSGPIRFDGGKSDK